MIFFRQWPQMILGETSRFYSLTLRGPRKVAVRRLSVASGRRFRLVRPPGFFRDRFVSGSAGESQINYEGRALVNWVAGGRALNNALRDGNNDPGDWTGQESNLHLRARHAEAESRRRAAFTPPAPSAAILIRQRMVRQGAEPDWPITVPWRKMLRDGVGESALPSSVSLEWTA